MPGLTTGTWHNKSWRFLYFNVWLLFLCYLSSQFNYNYKLIDSFIERRVKVKCMYMIVFIEWMNPWNQHETWKIGDITMTNRSKKRSNEAFAKTTTSSPCMHSLPKFSVRTSIGEMLHNEITILNKSTISIYNIIV